MSQGGKYGSASRLLICAVVVFFFAAQYQIGTHAHHIDTIDANHECTVCVVAGHFDDVDANELSTVSIGRPSAKLATHAEAPVKQSFSAQAKVRGPPIL